jgi:hypothetical protein
MAKPKGNSRSAPRIPWQLPASLKYSKRSHSQVELRDVSSRGLFFFSQDPLEEDAKVEIVLMMPPEVEGFGRQWVCVQATVVRVEEAETPEKIGVAAVIDRCELLPQI